MKAGITYGPRLEAPDYERIAADAEKDVVARLGIVVRPQELLVQAAQIVEQADAELGLYLEERDRALTHLYFYDPRLGMPRTAGLTPVGYRKAIAHVVYGDRNHALPRVESNEELAAVGKQLGVKRVKDVEAKFVEAAKTAYAARTRRELAARYMHEAVFALSEAPYNWTPDEIADHANLDRRLIYKQRAAARRRRGV